MTELAGGEAGDSAPDDSGGSEPSAEAFAFAYARNAPDRGEFESRQRGSDPADPGAEPALPDEGSGDGPDTAPATDPEDEGAPPASGGEPGGAPIVELPSPFGPGFLPVPASGSRQNPVPAPTPAPIPEPATWLLLIGGFGLVGLALRRRARRAVV